MTKPPGGWTLLAQVAIAILTTACLCVWQISRGFEKLELRVGYLDQLKAEPIAESKFTPTTPAYQRINILGKFDATRTYFVSNQRDAGRPGFWVYTRFDSAYESFLVNRGFAPVQGSWFANPDVATPTTQMTIAGVVWPNAESRSSKELETNEWPMRIARIDIDEMAKTAGTYPIEIRLFADSPGVLRGAPISIADESARHWGYAAQWVLIGSLIFAGYWYFFLRLKQPRDTAT